MLRSTTPPRCRLALIESPGRGRNFRKMSDARSILVPPFSHLTFSSRQRDAARRDAMLHVCIRNAKGPMHTHERTGNVFLQVACSPLANCPSSARDPIHPSLLSTPRDSTPSFILAERGRPSPFYPLSFILYPLYPSLPRQADASAPE